MAGTFRRITTYKGSTRTSVTVPQYLWRAFVALHVDEVDAIATVKSWRDIRDSYEAASRMFDAVLRAARQRTLPGMDE